MFSFLVLVYILCVSCVFSTVHRTLRPENRRVRASTTPNPQKAYVRLSIESITADDVIQIINATVVDHSGADITSNFDIMVFYNSSAPSNMTLPMNETQPLDRRTSTPLVSYRPIIYCEKPGTTFQTSECNPTDQQQGGVQTYTIVCRRDQHIFDPYTAKFLYTQPYPERRSGRCENTEVCMNGQSPSNGELNGNGIKYAYCVQKSAFLKYAAASRGPLGLKLDKMSMVKELEGKRMSMFVSKPDQSTPLEVDRFDVEAEVADDGNGKDPGAGDRCRDCMELETQQFKQGTESLKAEARMLTTGAIAGVLWLAIVSG